MTDSDYRVALTTTRMRIRACLLTLCDDFYIDSAVLRMAWSMVRAHEIGGDGIDAAELYYMAAIPITAGFLGMIPLSKGI
jgi:hypothetical protein